MLFLPETLVSVTREWLDTIDPALDEILGATSDIDSTTAARVVLAVGGVREHTSRFRQVLRGEAEIDQRADSDWVPLSGIDRALAEQIHGEVIQATSRSKAVLNTAHATLADAAERKAFLLQVGDVAGIAFVNLAQRLWDDYPDLAPAYWTDGEGPVGA